MKRILFFIALGLIIISCQEKDVLDNKIKIVCTTGMLGDAVKNLVDTNFNVVSLMGPGVDPHLYKATQGDLKQLASADLIVYNGLHLEGKMGELFEKLSKQKRILAAAETIEEQRLINNTDFQGAHDPHVWFDVELWGQVVQSISKVLIEEYPEHQSSIAANTKKHLSEIKVLNEWVSQQILTIDSTQRVLITAHDAFSYFGRAYQIEVKGLQGISTVSEYGLKDVSNLVNFITNNKIKAVFVESSVSDRSLKAVQEGCNSKGHDLNIGGTLYSDAMGAEGTEEGTYIGMVKYNVNTIVKALK